MENYTPTLLHFSHLGVYRINTSVPKPSAYREPSWGYSFFHCIYGSAKAFQETSEMDENP